MWWRWLFDNLTLNNEKYTNCWQWKRGPCKRLHLDVNPLINLGVVVSRDIGILILIVSRRFWNGPSIMCTPLLCVLSFSGTASNTLKLQHWKKASQYCKGNFQPALVADYANELRHEGGSFCSQTIGKTSYKSDSAIQVIAGTKKNRTKKAFGAAQGRMIRRHCRWKEHSVVHGERNFLWLFERGDVKPVQIACGEIQHWCRIEVALQLTILKHIEIGQCRKRFALRHLVVAVNGFKWAVCRLLRSCEAQEVHQIWGSTLVG